MKRSSDGAALQTSAGALPAGEARRGPSGSWFAAAGAVAATYFYFLIFAEFGFLELARATAPERLRGIMGALGAGGIAGAALGSVVYSPARRRVLLTWAFRACAVSAALALGAKTQPALIAVAGAVGISLGVLTVVLTAGLRDAVRGVRLGLCVGVGTGTAYAACNVPAVFQASPAMQTTAAALVAAVAAFAPRWMNGGVGDAQTSAGAVSELRPFPPSAAPRTAVAAEYGRASVARWIVILFALVWMDSAAFYIVQHTPALRAATWAGAEILSANAVVHLVAALAAGLAIDRGARAATIAVAAGALVLACAILGGALPAAIPAEWCYTAGVSLYSVVLVEYPARGARAGLAAAVFAIAGWLGSALGIGMAQDLQRIPPAFVVVAAAMIGAALLGRARALRAMRAAAWVAAVLVGSGAMRAAAPTETGAKAWEWAEAEMVSRGREVYMAEGCIHCHSQFIRPRAALDVQRWGPTTTLAESLDAAPPLFGTRRQGPDLSHVGNRRSSEWNRLHLLAPREVSPGSRMPSYAHLFAEDDVRGSALLAYLAALGGDGGAERRAQIAAWKPDTSAAIPVDESRRRFVRLCSACHGESGRGDGALAKKLSYPPPDWKTAAWRHARDDREIETALCRIIKFGLPGLAMAGHEYLPDADVVGLARYVRTLHNQRRDGPAVATRP